jgi:2-desacetyl-2-hydroxyethyl bacteriochlorophyllide A dehydrogenase
LQAALLREIPSKQLDVVSVSPPTVSAPDDLVVRVEACGICGTDLHILEGHSYRPELPFVLGHEPVGTVTQAGKEVAGRWLGRRVTMTLFTGCGQCPDCQVGRERICPRLRSISGVLGAWGGYAEYMVIHSAQAVEVPSALSDVEAATLVDCGATAANAVRVALQHHPRHVAVVGAGPIGFIAAEMLRAQGISIEVVQSSEPRRSAIRDLGYQVVAKLGELDHPPDTIIDCAGNAQVTVDSIEALAPAGMYVAAGYATVPSFELPHVARKELTLRGVRSGSRDDLVQVMDLTASGRISLPLIQTWALNDINQAFSALRDRRVPGKAVVVP